MALAILAMIVINKVLEKNPKYQQMKMNVLEFVSCKKVTQEGNADAEEKTILTD